MAETAGLTELAAVGREDYSDATNTASCEYWLEMLFHGIVSETGTDTGTDEGGPGIAANGLASKGTDAGSGKCARLGIGRATCSQRCGCCK